jgi:hypothetical protein
MIDAREAAFGKVRLRNRRSYRAVRSRQAELFMLRSVQFREKLLPCVMPIKIRILAQHEQSQRGISAR